MTTFSLVPKPAGWGPLPDLSEQGSASRRKRVLLIITALWIINFFDAGLTLLAHRQGILFEMNPVGEWFLRLGPDTLVFFKLAMVLIGTSILWRMRNYPVAELAAWVLLCAYVAVALQWHRCYEYFLAVGDLRLIQPGSVHL